MTCKIFLQGECLPGGQELRFPQEVLAEEWFLGARQVKLCNSRKHLLKTLPDKWKKYGFENDCSLLNKKIPHFCGGSNAL